MSRKEPDIFNVVIKNMSILLVTKSNAYIYSYIIILLKKKYYFTDPLHEIILINAKSWLTVVTDVYLIFGDIAPFVCTSIN